MSLVLVGVSHHTLGVAERERFAVSPERYGELDRALLALPGVAEALLLSTCNRTELLADSPRPERAGEELRRFLCETLGGGAVCTGVSLRVEEEVVRHVYRVCASLDSMVIGEAQILGQVKAAYRAAVEARSCGPILNRLLQGAFRAAKRVRSETRLGDASTSLAKVGVQLAAELYESLEAKRVVLVGAGEMAESALAGLRRAGVGEVVVVNRTLERAQALAARIGTRAAPLEALSLELAQASIALVSVAGSGPLVSPATLGLARGGEPLLLVDLSLPRAVDPVVGELDGVYLYDLDDLEGVAQRGLAERAASIAPAEALVAEEGERFLRWRAGLAAVPTIQALDQRVRDLARAEVRRTLRSLPVASPELERALLRTADALAAKLLHPALRALRTEAEEKAAPYYADAVRRMFGLEGEEDA